MEFEVSDKVAVKIAEMLSTAGGTPVTEEPLSETVSTKKIQGSIQLRGFDPDVTNRISSNLRFRVDAVNLGSRVRVIIDIQK